jgi:hypothetical protein
VRQYAWLLFIIGLSGCGQGNPDAPRTDSPNPEHAADLDLQNVAATKPPGGSRAYDAAVNCWALSDVVETLVESEAVHDPIIIVSAPKQLKRWRNKSREIGLSISKSSSDTMGDFELKQYDLISPLKSLDGTAAQRNVEALVHAASECR